MNEGCPQGRNECNSGCSLYTSAHVFENAQTRALEWHEGCKYFTPVTRVNNVLTVEQIVNRYLAREGRVDNRSLAKLFSEVMQLKGAYNHLENKYNELTKVIKQFSKPLYEGVEV